MTLLTANLINCEFLYDGIFHLWLQLPADQTLDYQAGQYLYFVLANGDERPYSIANAPLSGNEQGLLEFHIHYHQSDNKFTKPLFEELLTTKKIHLRGPEGHCTYHVPDASHWILLAGGTGLAPCQAIIEAAIENKHMKPIHLYWGVRTTKHLYIHSKLQYWAEHYPWFKYTPVLFMDPDLPIDFRHGIVHDEVVKDFPDLTKVEVYVSGPEVMVFSAQKQLLANGLPEKQFFSDYM